MANTVFENKVIEAKATNLLTTSVNTRSLLTVDATLAETEGMTKVINTYAYTGKVEKLEDGAKNSVRGKISFVGKDYKVQRAQQVFDYSDTDFMNDNKCVDIALKGANEEMTNALTADFYTECAKANVSHSVEVFNYEGIVDAISILKVEDESKLFVVIPTSWKAEIRKDEDYKHAQMGAVVYNGQVGTICGIPVIATNAIEDVAYVMTNEAVKLFMKKEVEVEQDRDVETKINTVVLTTYYITALVDNSKICKITKG